jgi:hypothetical protein
MKKVITIFCGLAILSSSLTLLAASEPIQGNNCNIAVYPYNPSATPLYSENGADAKVNFLTDNGGLSQTDCRSRIPYDNEHNQDQLNSQYSATSLDGSVQVPRATHVHSYVNNMKQDNYYYRSFIYNFDIELEKDTLQNTKLENVGNSVPEGFNLTCTTPSNTATPELHKCNGYNANAFGGTKVTIYEQPDRWVIRWSFGVNPAGEHESSRMADVPARWGNDSDLNDALANYLTSKGINPGTVDLADQYSLYRTFDPEVTLTSKNKTQSSEGSKSIWTATTTSRVEVMNYAIAKNRLTELNNGTIDYNTFFEKYCTNSDDGKDYINENGQWNECHNFQYWTPVNSVPSSSLTLPATYINDTKIDYKNSNGNPLHLNKSLWIPVGSVASIWKSTPPPTDLGCADLQWDGAFLKKNAIGTYTPAIINQNALLPDESAVMKFKTIYDSGTGTKRPLEYRWTSFYGDQNRPGWFTNEDTLFMQAGSAALNNYLLNSLPSRMLMVAHAAAKPASSGSAANNASQQTTAAQAAAQAALIKLGDFKDELASALSGNPLTDTDNQIYYSGGSEGVTVGVQAFYADGKNVTGAGPMVSTPDGQRQKAKTCHLELVIQPSPVTCIGLTLSPNQLQPNTPVTFTVTPKFNPNNKTIPLDYYWTADANKTISINDSLQKTVGNVGLQYVPGAQEKTGETTWVGNGYYQLVEAGLAGQSLFDPCANGKCEEQTYVPVQIPDGGKPVINPVNQLNNPALNQNNLNQQQQLLQNNLFNDFGKAAVLNPNTSASQQNAAVSGNQSAIQASQAALAVPANGGFKDSQTSGGLAANPYLETTDNKTYYTGGPGETVVKVVGQGKDGTKFPSCSASLTLPPEAKCQQLKVKFLNQNIEVAKENLVADKTYTIQVDQANSKKTDGTPVTKYSVAVYNENGPGKLLAAAGNAASCSPIAALQVINPGPVAKAYGTVPSATAVSCSYVYTPKAGDKITLLANPDDGVAACKIEQVIPQTGAICKSLNLTTDPVLANKEIAQGQLVGLNTQPRDTANAAREPVLYGETGNGRFIAAPGNAASCPAVPTSGIPLPVNIPIRLRTTELPPQS